VGPPGFEPESRESKTFEKVSSYQKKPDLEAFKDFCKIDLNLTESTCYLHARLIRKFLQTINKDPRTATRFELRQYLMQIKDANATSTYKNVLSSLKRFYRDFLGMKDMVNSFRFPSLAFKPIRVPTREELKTYFHALDCTRDRALFLIYASSGLRNSEVLSLDRFKDVDFEKRMIIPRKRENHSKHVWISYFNEETEKELQTYLQTFKSSNRRLFPISKRHVLRIFKKARKKTGIKITPQKLRDWFCSEMGSLGVPDRYVDAFCGRVPKSVLARHYTDFSPEKLKRIYDKAGLEVFE
jgi:site-specific recombinase XerD